MAGSGQRFDFRLPVAFLGDLGVGISSLILRETRDSFTTSFTTKLQTDYIAKTYTDIDGAQGKRIEAQLIDDIGKHSRAFLVFLVYDVTDEQSFQNILNHLKNLQTVGVTGCSLVLLGNKCDQTSEKVVETARGQALAASLTQQMGIEVPFFEVSAKLDIDVHEAFKKGIADAYRRFSPQPVPQPLPQPAAPLPPPATSFLTSLKNFFRAAGRLCAAAGRGIGAIIAWPFRMAARGISRGFSSPRSPGGEAAASIPPGPGHTAAIIQSQNQANEPPNEYLCPITGILMKDPVMTEAGFTYERVAITQWLADHNTDPVNRNQHCTIQALRPNQNLKSLIQDWKGLHPEYKDGHDDSQEEKKSVPSTVLPSSVQASIQPRSTGLSTTQTQADRTSSSLPTARGR